VTGCHYYRRACGYLCSLRASSRFDRYQFVLLGNRSIRHKQLAQDRYSIIVTGRIRTSDPEIASLANYCKATVRKFQWTNKYKAQQNVATQSNGRINTDVVTVSTITDSNITTHLTSMKWTHSSYDRMQHLKREQVHCVHTSLISCVTCHWCPASKIQFHVGTVNETSQVHVADQSDSPSAVPQCRTFEPTLLNTPINEPLKRHQTKP